VPVPLRADDLDLAMLELIDCLGHVLSSQLHRRFNRGRAITTTQRRLKRLSDAGLVERFQFHRRDGGGVPMCYVISARGRDLLTEAGRGEGCAASGSGVTRSPGPAGDRGGGLERDRGGERLRWARRDVHVAGWALALLEVAHDPRSKLRGRERSVPSPPRRSLERGHAALSPSELRLPDGRVPHDFLRCDGPDQLVEAERFETVRPDATIELARPPLDVMVEFDDRLGVDVVAKLQRFDHFLTGWSAHTRRYGERASVEPLIVFVCRDSSRARRCAELADSALRACRAYAGEYPSNWEYVGRSQIVFVAERDLHEHVLRAYGVPSLPPAVRAAARGGDPAAAESCVEQRMLLDVADLAR
jgi:hypothetical protein